MITLQRFSRSLFFLFFQRLQKLQMAVLLCDKCRLVANGQCTWRSPFLFIFKLDLNCWQAMGLMMTCVHYVSVRCKEPFDVLLIATHTHTSSLSPERHRSVVLQRPAEFQYIWIKRECGECLFRFRESCLYKFLRPEVSRVPSKPISPPNVQQPAREEMSFDCFTLVACISIAHCAYFIFFLFF